MSGEVVSRGARASSKPYETTTAPIGAGTEKPAGAPAFGITGGDGLQVVWEETVGTARTKWLLWTGENIDARTALDWGAVNEVVPHERAYARGLEIATKLAAKPDLYRRLQKQTLNQRLRRRIVEGVPYGMALEGLTAADLAYQGQGQGQG